MNQRGRRISEMILREIGTIVQFEMRDPRIKMITITNVRLADDLSFAKIYFTSSAKPEEIKEIGEALNHAQGFFRTKISERIDMKYVPQLKFYFDEGLEHANRIEELFRQIKKD